MSKRRIDRELYFLLPDMSSSSTDIAVKDELKKFFIFDNKVKKEILSMERAEISISGFIYGVDISTSSDGINIISFSDIAGNIPGFILAKIFSQEFGNNYYRITDYLFYELIKEPDVYNLALKVEVIEWFPKQYMLPGGIVIKSYPAITITVKYKL